MHLSQSSSINIFHKLKHFIWNIYKRFPWPLKHFFSYYQGLLYPSYLSKQMSINLSCQGLPGPLSLYPYYLSKHISTIYIYLYRELPGYFKLFTLSNWNISQSNRFHLIYINIYIPGTPLTTVCIYLIYRNIFKLFYNRVRVNN